MLLGELKSCYEGPCITPYWIQANQEQQKFFCRMCLFAGLLLELLQGYKQSGQHRRDSD